jgi:hypothetical protein
MNFKEWLQQNAGRVTYSGKVELLAKATGWFEINTTTPSGLKNHLLKTLEITVQGLQEDIDAAHKEYEEHISNKVNAQFNFMKQYTSKE